MFLHIMVGQNSKKSNAKEATFFSFDVMLQYICVKIIHVVIFFKTPNMMEMIFNIYEICNIYQPL